MKTLILMYVFVFSQHGTIKSFCDMPMLCVSVYELNHTENELEPKSDQATNEELELYINDLIVAVQTNNKSRSFNFQRENVEVNVCIRNMVQGINRNTQMESIANRLLTIEIDTQERYPVADIQKGVFIQALLEDAPGELIYIAAKAEKMDYLNDDYHREQGLPVRRKIYKAMRAEIADGEVNSIHVLDTNPSISKYWWSDFLELEEIFSDEENTKRAFNSLKKKILLPIKKKSSADFVQLYNAALTYCRRDGDFDINEVAEIFETHTPVKEDLSLEGVAEKVRELPNQMSFDSTFRNQPTEIKENLRREQIPLIQGALDLTIKDTIPNLRNKVTPVLDDETGRKYLTIETDTGYDHFNG